MRGFQKGVRQVHGWPNQYAAYANDQQNDNRFANPTVPRDFFNAIQHVRVPLLIGLLLVQSRKFLLEVGRQNRFNLRLCHITNIPDSPAALLGAQAAIIPHSMYLLFFIRNDRPEFGLLFSRQVKPLSELIHIARVVRVLP